MLTFSILWVVLATAVTMIAMRKRTASAAPDPVPSRPNQSEHALAWIAVLSCLALVAGFVYVGRFLVAGL